MILGGTGWLGREIARAVVIAGDDVTCLARGSSGTAPEGAKLVRADRRTPDAYAAVSGEWDEVVEIAWDVPIVRSALAALAPRAAHWSLVSTVSVYASNSTPGADETDPVVEPVDLSDYGQAKVAVERASVAALGERLLVVRPGLIAGPGDPSDRFGYWVSRMALADGEPVLSMRAANRTTQVIDVRDLATFVAAGRHTGVLNAVGDVHPLAEVFDHAARIAGFAGPRVDAADDWLLDHDVEYWAGPRSLPLWLPDEDAAMTAKSNAALHAAGASLRDLDETLVDTLADEVARGLDRPRRAGLARLDELALLDQLG